MLAFSLFAFTASAVIVHDVADGQCASLKQDTDYAGGPICTYENCPRTSTAEGCCSECAANIDCAKAVYFQGVCYMKTNSAVPMTSSGRLSVEPVKSHSSMCKTYAQDTDYDGGSLCTWDNCPRTSSAEGCCASCEENTECAHAVYFQGVCYLKDASATPKSNPGRIALTSATPAPVTPAPFPGPKIEWRIELGDINNSSKNPELQMSIDGSEFKPFQMRGFDYSPIDKCCGNNDFAPFNKALYQRDIPRMAAMGANTIKLYGICDGVTDSSNLCGTPSSNCNVTRNSVEDVMEFLDFLLEHKMFVLLANRNMPGNLEAYKHMAKTYGGHPAVAGVILYDEALDYNNFNAAAQASHEGFCRAFGKDPRTTSVLENGRIITTAMLSFDALDANFEAKYGEYINGWGFDPYARFTYDDFRNNWSQLFKLPFKPFFLMENGINGPVDHWPAQIANYGCRETCDGCHESCFTCASFSSNFKQYIELLKTSKLAGHFIFEWTDENWKANPNPCNEITCGRSRWDFGESNHGIFHVTDGPPGSALIPKALDSNGTTFETVIKASWGAETPGPHGYRGWM